MRFKNRQEAGKALASALMKYKDQDVVVYAIPRGGVPVGIEVAKALSASFDLVIPRKIGSPTNPEYAICVVGENDHCVVNEEEVAKIDKDWLERRKMEEKQEARRRRTSYMAGLARPEIKGRVAIIVDDGVATGMTFLYALADIKKRGPGKIVAALPIASLDTVKKIETEVDETVILDQPSVFAGAVGAYYDEFPEVEDLEVIELIRSLR